MKKELFIAEKKSLAKNIIKAFQENWKEKEGYFESDFKIVAYARGHILENYSVNDYEGEKVKWKDIKLPYIPSIFKLKANKTTLKEFNTIQKILKEKEISKIIHTGDSEREGQLIIDNILKYFQSNIKDTKVYRLWIPEQTEKGIQEAYQNMKENREYINLSREALARSVSDWILGINLSVLLTVKSGELFKVGRLIYPILYKVHERTEEIKNFKKKTYFQLETEIQDNENNVLSIIYDEKFESKNDEEIEKIKKIKRIKAIKVEESVFIKKPSKLFNLGDLQAELSNKFNYSYEKSLEIIQGLYEEGYLTYPRTDSRYLTINESEKVEEILQRYGNDYENNVKNKNIYNDSEVDSHSAIIITSKEKKEFTEEEKNIYETVEKRFLSNFLKEKTIIAKKEIIFLVGEKEIKKEIKSIKEKGFLILEPMKEKEKFFNIEEGNEFSVIFELKEKETTPPPKINEVSLAKYLENPFTKEIKENKELTEESVKNLKKTQLGTQATRTNIIKKMYDKKENYNYLELKNKNFEITEKGIRLVEIVKKLDINIGAERTVELLNDVLIKVNEGKINLEEVKNIIKEELLAIIEKTKNINIQIPKEEEREEIGRCPRCHNPVYENSKAFFCSNRECGLALWKDYKFFEHTLKITKAKAKKLLTKKTVDFKSNGKEIKNLELKINGKYANLVRKK